ncbi:MAG: hypothetical protein J7L44_04140 [Candidatus Diapherotrites archaeon]|nr:hypothetical protein [Candidatus Diapherotrites archaeon]
MLTERNKGQLTIDFLFAFLYILIMVSALFTIQNNFVKNQNVILIRAQEKRIAYKLAEMINSSVALSDGTAEIRFRVPGIRYLNKTQPMPCDITIGDDYIKVSLNVDGMQIDENVSIVKPTHINITGNRCGEEFVITYT